MAVQTSRRFEVARWLLATVIMVAVFAPGCEAFFACSSGLLRDHVPTVLDAPDQSPIHESFEASQSELAEPGVLKCAPSRDGSFWRRVDQRPCLARRPKSAFAAPYSCAGCADVIAWAYSYRRCTGSQGQGHHLSQYTATCQWRRRLYRRFGPCSNGLRPTDCSQSANAARVRLASSSTPQLQPKKSVAL